MKEDGRGWKRRLEETGGAEEDRKARSSSTFFISSQTIQTRHLLGLLFD